PGSFTQFILRSDICACQVPMFTPRILDACQSSDAHAEAEQTYFGAEELFADPEIDIEEGTFPISRYELIKSLGSGSNGSVFLAGDKLLKRKVAVKVLRSLAPQRIISFQKEARAIGRLRHPSLVKLLDFGITDGGSPYMVLDYVRGRSLEQVLNDNGPMNWQVCLDVFVDLCN